MSSCMSSIFIFITDSLGTAFLLCGLEAMVNVQIRMRWCPMGHDPSLNKLLRNHDMISMWKFRKMRNRGERIILPSHSCFAALNLLVNGHNYQSCPLPKTRRRCPDGADSNLLVEQFWLNSERVWGTSSGGNRETGGLYKLQVENMVGNPI